jgi:hypothetical protein
LILEGDIEARVLALVKERVPSKGGGDKPFYRFFAAPDKAKIIEEEASGEAEVECTVPEGYRCIQWTLIGVPFGFLKENKSADGALLVWRQDGTIEAHIMECKRTVDQKKWVDVSKQMGSTLSRLMALVGALGERIERVRLYTAFRSDQLSDDESPNTAGLKRTVGGPDERSEAEREHDWAWRKQREWMRDQVRLPSFAPTFEHRKVQLDASGHGAVTLDVARGAE